MTAEEWKVWWRLIRAFYDPPYVRDVPVVPGLGPTEAHPFDCVCVACNRPLEQRRPARAAPHSCPVCGGPVEVAWLDATLWGSYESQIEGPWDCQSGCDIPPELR